MFLLIDRKALVARCRIQQPHTLGGAPYRFAYNGQERVDDMKGPANHYTALYNEYDPRYIQRPIDDPKPLFGVSPYSMYKGNPILFSDPLGDVVKTNKEGSEIIQQGLKGALGNSNNPVEYDATKGELTFNDKVDLSGLTAEQSELIGRYKQLIKDDKTTVNVNIVNETDNIPEFGRSLRELGASGINGGPTITPNKPETHLNLLQTVKAETMSLNVYIARDPTMTVGGNPTNRRSEPKGYSGYTSIHEIAGHAYERARDRFLILDQKSVPYRVKYDVRNLKVESFDRMIRSIYKLNSGSMLSPEAPLHDRYFSPLIK